MRINRAIEDLSSAPQVRNYFKIHKDIINGEQKSMLVDKIDSIMQFETTEHWEIEILEELKEDIQDYEPQQRNS